MQQTSEQITKLSHEDLPNSAVYPDIPPKSLLQKENLNTINDIGVLDWNRPPINDIYSRSPFETYQTGYKYDLFGNTLAYLKKPPNIFLKVIFLKIPFLIGILLGLKPQAQSPFERFLTTATSWRTDFQCGGPSRFLLVKLKRNTLYENHTPCRISHQN
ncbi:MAG: hypothetical protein EZS28_012089 [Streblomastix strix]|uniref:Uncharacterized protein n=1 Tax=Streblomastix strix TaxID=222440 RepID=A0A5J4WCT5_9EUKA|nr:MAG: hypothetical protein EZS28_012089 [Streblomastix strix]